MSVSALPVPGPAVPRSTGATVHRLNPPRPVDRALTIVGADVRVTLPSGVQVGYANLDYAASAPCLRAAADAVAELLPLYASVHRGAGALSQLCTRRFEESRETVKDFLGCRDDDTVIFTRHTTDALNLLARALPPRTTVVTFAGEHHANLLPWPRVVRLPAPASAHEAVQSVDAALRVLARDADGPLLVSVTGASNVTGERWPLASLAVLAHRYGARICADLAQLAPHHPVDVAEWGLDYVALSGHKMYAPFGIGVLAGRPDWLDAAPPYLAGGGATTRVGDGTHDIAWATGAARHEAGTPNLVGAVALAAVCAALATADRSALAAAEADLVARLRHGISALDRVRELHAFPADQPRVGIVAFAVAGLDSADVSARLSRDWGIGVRDGLFCAHPLTRRLLLEAGLGGRARSRTAAPTAIRASLGIGSTVEHVNRLVAALGEIAG